MTKILIVEDDPTQRLVASSVMKSAGYEILEAVDGAAGLDLARLHQPDLVLCDVQMPGMSGFEFLEALRGEADLAQTPVIMVTALGQRAHVRIGMVAGADDYIGKPFSAFELKEAVAAQLSRRKLQQEHLAELEGQVESAQRELADGLEEKMNILAVKYEKQLADEINRRWSQDGNSDEVHEQAVVLKVNLFDFILSQPPGDGMRTRTIRRLHEKCRDALYLFGAKRLVPYGNDLLAVFNVDARTDLQKAKVKAVRAALVLRKTFFEVIGPYRFELVSRGVAMKHASVSIALGSGSLVLSQFTDPLHGDETSVLASGEAVQAVQVLQGWAQNAGWELLCLSGMTEGLGAMASMGRTSVIKPDGAAAPLEVQELLALKA